MTSAIIMSQTNKLVVYYSCFNYEIENQDFEHIENLRNISLQSLGQQWVFSLQHELELLNISLAKYGLELSCEVYFSLLAKDFPNVYESFKNIFINELSLNTIWIAGNAECNFLDELLFAFYNVAKDAMVDSIPSTFKLLPSVKKQPVLQPLVIAEEAVTTLAEKICHVLKKVSMPLEGLVGPEITTRLTSYIKSLSSRVIKTSQVTSNFVTNIIEVKPGTEGLKVRVIQPAKEFYDKVVDSWAAISDQNNSTSFLLDLKQKLGGDWNEKFVSPALCFFEIAQEEWAKAKGLGHNYFLRRLQDRLIDTWRQAIIETSKTFQEHMITKTVMY